MERRHILIEDTDGTDVTFMGYTVASIRGTLGSLPSFKEPEQPALAVVELPPPEAWWQWAWRILNMDIFELWRTYGPKSTRRD